MIGSAFLTRTNKLIPTSKIFKNYLQEPFYIDIISKYCKEYNMNYIMGRDYKEVSGDIGNFFNISYERFLYNKMEPYVTFEMNRRFENKKMERFIQSVIYTGDIPRICIVCESCGPVRLKSVQEDKACVYLKYNNIPYVVVNAPS
jgi:hypothetical protein